MKRIIFATGNAGKMREIKEIMADLPVQVVSMKEAGIDAAIVEDGKTFEENALIKARTVARVSGEIAFADDSGLEVDYLDKEPGIYSARYLSEETPYSIKNQTIISRLEGVHGEKRSARFVCAIACVLSDGTEFVTRATIEGLIALAPAGDNGFGYDPIFYVPKYDKTTAQLSIEEKNKISHRAKALREMKEILLSKGLL